MNLVLLEVWGVIDASTADSPWGSLAMKTAYGVTIATPSRSILMLVEILILVLIVTFVGASLFVIETKGKI